MIFITEQAARMIHLSAASSDCQGQPLRLSATKDASGGLHFKMGFDEERPGDVRWECLHGVVVVVGEEESRNLLQNMMLDFRDMPPAGPQFAFLSEKKQPEAT
ncbi:MAG: hypothetical protein HQL51_00785 [Magnetococcales bacterium]|nr:hypothetical protein [Magnetococcales bacterium]